MDLLQKQQQHKTEKVQVKTEEGSGDWHQKTSTDKGTGEHRHLNTQGEGRFKRAASATN